MRDDVRAKLCAGDPLVTWSLRREGRMLTQVALLLFLLLLPAAPADLSAAAYGVPMVSQ